MELAYERGLPIGKQAFLMVDWWDDFSEYPLGSSGLVTHFSNDGTPTGSWTFNSGGFGNGRAPRGSWSVIEFWGSTFPDTKTGKWNPRTDGESKSLQSAGFYREGFSFKIGVPTPGTGRDGILFHPDGGSLGTNGCLGLNCSVPEMKRFVDITIKSINTGGLKVHIP